MICTNAPWPGHQEGQAFERFFALTKQAGFDGVHLWWDAFDDGQDYRRQPELARRAGLYVENLHAPFDDINGIWEDTAAGQAVFELYLRCVDDCAAFGVPAMVMHPSRGRQHPQPNQLGLERFRRIVDRAERSGVNVTIENIFSQPKIECASWLLEEIASPRFGFCFDAGHFNIFANDMLARFGHRLMALHLHDNDGAHDQHRLPFDGNADWPALMRAVAETGYEGPTSLEIKADPQWYGALSPEEFAILAYERAARLDKLRQDAL